jgi:hypothetical protein
MAAMRTAKWGLTAEVAAAVTVAEVAGRASSGLPCAASQGGNQQAWGWSMPCGDVAGDQEIGVEENADGVVKGGPSRK